ncbi:hypothetical protein BMS3Bbin04_00382 [bacterium BMS3Bbin04]|nr:hypothetical protein BMS3Bbin04_00382 [bacterium BMS3Bbin04]
MFLAKIPWGQIGTAIGTALEGTKVLCDWFGGKR